MSLWWRVHASFGGILAGNLAAATPPLHPSRGERDHTVLVRWRVPLVVLRWRRGGGVVASWVYDVSVEYGGSVEYGVCYEAVVAGAPKEG